MLGNHGRLSLLLFIGAVLGVGLFIGWMTPPGEWYERLAKPFFNPPNWIFGPVWTGLYIVIGVVGWRLWHKASDSVTMKLWFAQMGLNWLWSPTFFGLQAPGLALVVIVGLLVAIAAFILAARRIDPLSAWLFVPYLLWVGFATMLNLAIVVLN